MKPTMIFFILIAGLTLGTACTEEEAMPLTGEAIISVDNQTLFNQSDYFVVASIVFFESDEQSLINFGRHDISKGGKVTFDPVTLNPGNYYVRYDYYLGNSKRGNTQHKPFQVQAGEETLVKIIR